VCGCGNLELGGEEYRIGDHVLHRHIIYLPLLKCHEMSVTHDAPALKTHVPCNHFEVAHKNLSKQGKREMKIDVHALTFRDSEGEGVVELEGAAMCVWCKNRR